jgi:hypothetical protein
VLVRQFGVVVPNATSTFVEEVGTEGQVSTSTAAARAHDATPHIVEAAQADEPSAMREGVDTRLLRDTEPHDQPPTRYDDGSRYDDPGARYS